MAAPAVRGASRGQVSFLAINEQEPIRRRAADSLAVALQSVIRAVDAMGAAESSRWRRQHPDRPFSEYYATRIEAKLARGNTHKTLGRIDFPRKKMAGQRRRVGRLVEWGLEPVHRFVDFGCGSLRLGQHLIRYLDAGNYVGLDVTPTFFRVGIDLIGDTLVREKRPRLLVIDPPTISQLAQDPPDFLLSNAVLHHVHPSELDDYLANVLRLTGPSTRSFLTFREWRREIRIADKSWAHSARELVERIAALDPTIDVAVQRQQKTGGLFDPSWKSTLQLTRRSSR